MKALRWLTRIDAFRLALYIGAVFIALLFYQNVGETKDIEVPILSRIEYATRDFAFTNLRGPRKPSGDVVIIAVDESSVNEEGLWPWSRAKIARLVEEAAKGGMAAVGFDMVWADADEQGDRLAALAQGIEEARAGVKDLPSAKRLDALLQVAAGKDPGPVSQSPSKRLSDAIGAAQNVSVGFLLLDVSDFGGKVPSEAKIKEQVAPLAFLRADTTHVTTAEGTLVPKEGLTVGRHYSGAVVPIPEIADNAYSGGFFNAIPDKDGVIRHYQTVAQVGDLTLASLGCTTLAKALAPRGAQLGVVPIATVAGDMAGIRLGDLEAATDRVGRVSLNYYGPYGEFPTLSAADLLHGRIDASKLKGKIGVVGNTAQGTWDQRVTPFDRMTPGVITHVTFIENVLHDQLLHRSYREIRIELGVFLTLTFLLAFLFARVRSIFAVPALILVLGGWTAFASFALIEWRLVFSIGTPILMFASMYVAATGWRFFIEERDKRKARQTFSRFLAPAVVEELLKAGAGGLKLGGAKKELTVLFSDIRGFTTISERLDATLLIELLNQYLTPMTDIIVQDFEGTLDKYMGDAIMAFWGAPKELPDHPLLACRAALRMMARLRELKESWREKGLPEIDIGIGINTGPMSVGFVGSQDRFYNYTVLGDNVNLASRLEGANKEYGTNIIISAATYALVKEHFYVRELDAVRVKGKREPVVVYELIGAGKPDEAEQAFLSEFTWALGAYKSQRWDEAIVHFKAASEMRKGDFCARKYVTRCEAMRKNPPGPDWDGVYEMKTK
jgi:adenylate cyclase